MLFTVYLRELRAERKNKYSGYWRRTIELPAANVFMTVDSPSAPLWFRRKTFVRTVSLKYYTKKESLLILGKRIDLKEGRLIK